MLCGNPAGKPLRILRRLLRRPPQEDSGFDRDRSGARTGLINLPGPYLTLRIYETWCSSCLRHRSSVAYASTSLLETS